MEVSAASSEPDIRACVALLAIEFSMELAGSGLSPPAWMHMETCKLMHYKPSHIGVVRLNGAVVGTIVLRSMHCNHHAPVGGVWHYLQDTLVLEDPLEVHTPACLTTAHTPQPTAQRAARRVYCCGSTCTWSRHRTPASPLGRAPSATHPPAHLIQQALPAHHAVGMSAQPTTTMPPFFSPTCTRWPVVSICNTVILTTLAGGKHKQCCTSALLLPRILHRQAQLAILLHHGHPPRLSRPRNLVEDGQDPAGT